MAFFFHFCNVANKVAIIHKPISSNFAIQKMEKKSWNMFFLLLTWTVYRNLAFLIFLTFWIFPQKVIEFAT
jgi:hypothetical protein